MTHVQLKFTIGKKDIRLDRQLTEAEFKALGDESYAYVADKMWDSLRGPVINAFRDEFGGRR